jgi:dephospho-CoA kinase
MARRIAITGGMGAGKSLLASWLRQAGHPVVDADLEGRQLLEGNAALVEELADHFGRAILDVEGRLDRAALGRRAFASAEALQALNARVFPYLHRRLLERLQEEQRALDDRPQLALFLDAALVLEWGIQDAFDELWLVRAPDEVRLARAALRLGLSQDEARERLQRQWTQDAMACHAGLVLHNDGDEDRLFAQLLDALRQRALALPRRN